MEDKPKIARATALLAANAYALIATMRVIETTQTLPREAVLTIFVPVVGLGLSFALLEQNNQSNRGEIWAGVPVAVMVILWIALELLKRS